MKKSTTSLVLPSIESETNENENQRIFDRCDTTPTESFIRSSCQIPFAFKIDVNFILDGIESHFKSSCKFIENDGRKEIKYNQLFGRYIRTENRQMFNGYHC